MFIYLEVEKEEETVTKKAKKLIETWTENKKRSSVIQILKNELKNKDFSYLITKDRFQFRYVSDDKNIFSSVLSSFFLTQRNSLPVGIINYLINYFALMIYISNISRLCWKTKTLVKINNDRNYWTEDK